MPLPRLRRIWAAALALLVLACAATVTAAARAPGARSAASPILRDWTEFGLNPQRLDATNQPTGITATNVRRLHRRRVPLPGTVDSSPIYLHGASVAGATRDVIVVTTTYGRTLAIDAGSGRILWTFTPPGYSSWAGGQQITTATPLIDPDHQWVYSTASNGRVYKLALASGRAAGGAWPVTLTRLPSREKLPAALNLDGPYLVVTTGGYYGDTPPYQGHVALIDRASGRLAALWNSLCANRRVLMVPSTCPASDAAIWARSGAVVEPSGRLLVTTGNAPYNGRTDFGDSVIELTVPGLSVRQVYTPTDQARLNSGDLDLGSSTPALLTSTLAVMAGKDGILRLLDLDRLDGRPPGGAPAPGGQLQTLSTPKGGGLYSTPAVWHHGGQTTVFVGDISGTGSYTLSANRLHAGWSNSTDGSSPILAAGLLYVYDPNSGGIHVYSPASGRLLVTLPCGSGHWNSPIVVDGRVIEPEGNANDHSTQGTLDIFSAG